MEAKQGVINSDQDVMNLSPHDLDIREVQVGAITMLENYCARQNHLL